MKFNGNILIINPFYLMNQQNQEQNKMCPKWEDYDKSANVFDSVRKFHNDLLKWEGDYRCDWNYTLYGKRLDFIGFHDFVSKELKRTRIHLMHYKKNKLIDEKDLVISSGTVSVVNLEEAFSYNKKITSYLKYPNLCHTIEDFQGEIEFRTNENESVLILKE